MKSEYTQKRDNGGEAQEIKITKRGDGDDYIFISYKSDEKEVVIHKIVYELQKRYGLRVYYDKSFAEHNKSWVKQFRDNMEAKNCKGVLAFISNKYTTSYATLLELMHSQRECAGKLPVIPVNLEKIEKEYDRDDANDSTGLGKEGTNAEKEKETFVIAFDELSEQYKGIRYLYEKDRDFEKQMCHKIAYTLIQNLDVSENRYYKESDDLDRFFENLKETIKNEVGSSVFASPTKYSGIEEEKRKPQEAQSVRETGSEILSNTRGSRKAKKMKLHQMLEQGIVHNGDEVYVKGHPEAVGIIAGGQYIMYQGEELSLNQYVNKVLGKKGGVNAYIHVYRKYDHKLLDDLR